MMYRMVLVGFILTLAAPATAQDGGSAAAMMRALGGGGLTGKRLAHAIEAAQVHPLGSKLNPVRADGPRGERDYLSRLRRTAAPVFERGGSVGGGPYGYIMDVYSVVCTGNTQASVYMDMYHSKAVELRAVPGFDIVQP